MNGPRNLVTEECDQVSRIAAIAQTSRVPLGERLGRRSNQLEEQSTRVVRALDILARHPEFEEWLELRELLEGIEL